MVSEGNDENINAPALFPEPEGVYYPFQSSYPSMDVQGILDQLIYSSKEFNGFDFDGTPRINSETQLNVLFGQIENVLPLPIKQPTEQHRERKLSTSSDTETIISSENSCYAGIEESELPNHILAPAIPSSIGRYKMEYGAKMGGFGVTNGQFAEPSGIAVTCEGDVVVADTNNHRIQIFDGYGNFKSFFGEPGKRDGQLLYPNRVAINPTNGDFVITERSPTHQVQIFNRFGKFVRKFGTNVLQHPRGVCVDFEGNIIVVECKLMRVCIFTSKGDVLFKFSAMNYLMFPNNISVGPNKELFICDNRDHCVKVFNYDGEYLRRIGGEGITNYPISVSVDQFGHVMVVDNHNKFNLTVFDQEGNLITAFESKVRHAHCFDAAVFNGLVVVASKDYKVYFYNFILPLAMNKSSMCHYHKSNAVPNAETMMEHISSEHAEAPKLSPNQPSLFTLPSSINRYQMEYAAKLGGFGTSNGLFAEPSGISITFDGDIVVADTNNHRMQLFDAYGNFKSFFGEPGKRDGQLLYPNRVAINPTNGDFVITERSPTHQVQIFDRFGKFVRKFGTNVLQHPRGVCVDFEGNIIVVECKLMRVCIFGPDGTFKSKFSALNHLMFPNNISVGPNKELFICDNRDHCVKVFNYDGEYLRRIGGEGITNYPISVAVDNSGHVMVVDNHNKFNLTLFDPEGRIVSAFESKVRHAHCFDAAIFNGLVVVASKDYRVYFYHYQNSLLNAKL